MIKKIEAVAARNATRNTTERETVSKNRASLKSLRVGINLAVVLCALTFTSCEKSDKDIRDQYVGTWSYETVGSIRFTFSDGSVEEEPFNQSGTSVVTKSGDHDLQLGQLIFTVSDDNLYMEPIRQSYNQSGFVGSTTHILSGKLYSPELIEFTETFTGNLIGTLEYSGIAATITGQYVYTLTR